MPFARVVRRTVLATTLLAAALTVIPIAPPPSSAATGRSYVDAVPSWADAGHLAATQRDDGFEVEGEMFLPLRDPAGARAEATAISTPGSPSYRHFMTPTAWMQEHSPTQSDYDAVVDFLTSHGATITATPADREFVVFRQELYFADSTFQTDLRTYRVHGRRTVAPSTPPRLPAELADKVSSIVLDSGREQGPPTNPAPHVVQDDHDCEYAYGQTVVRTPKVYGRTRFPTDVCGYSSDQVRSGLGLQGPVAAGADGSGQTVAVLGTYDNASLLDDVNSLAQYENSGPLLASHFQDVTDQSAFNDTDLCGGPAGWQEENTMDVEAVHATAPGASIVYVGGFNCGGGTDAAMAEILDGDLATIVTCSATYTGEDVGLGLLQGETDLQLQAAAEGIGLYVASGDDGDNKDLGIHTANWPTTSPWVTSVGGATLAVDGDDRTVFESGWENAFARYRKTKDGLRLTQKLPGTFSGGSGGGRSSYFRQPAYQRGVVPARLASGGTGPAMRATPDIATDANPLTSMEIGFSPIGHHYFEVKLGAGTSLAAPLMAGKIADAQSATGQVLGFANPALYAERSAHPHTFGDILPITRDRYRAFQATLDYEKGHPTYVVSLDRGSTWHARRGYDLVTGLGDPAFQALVRAARLR